MIPINVGNVRDVLIACVIVASVYGLMRFAHYHHEVRARPEIRQGINLGEKTGSQRPASSQSAMEQAQQDSVIF